MSENTDISLAELLGILAEELHQAISPEFIAFATKLVVDLLHKEIVLLTTETAR